MNLIEQAVELSGLQGYTGRYTELVGGEVNDTYKLDFDNKQLVLRITRRPGRTTLLKEVRALSLFKHPDIPEIVFFDENKLVDGRYWVVETYIPGSLKARLDTKELFQLGKLLAEVHKIKNPEPEKLNLWQHFLYSCRSFGDEKELLNHPDMRLRKLITGGYEKMMSLQSEYEKIETRLVHGDATPSNILVENRRVRLIDWEFARFSDPMMEFSTIFYEDMEFNRGRWRIQITPQEKNALFSGYKERGGVIYEDRISFWMMNDKLGAAVYLYWKLHQSGEQFSDEITTQNELDLSNLVGSLEASL